MHVKVQYSFNLILRKKNKALEASEYALRAVAGIAQKLSEPATADALAEKRQRSLELPHSCPAGFGVRRIG